MTHLYTPDDDHPTSLAEAVAERVMIALELALETLRSDPLWTAPLRRTAASSLRASILELAEMADAVVGVRTAIDDEGALHLIHHGEAAAFMYRALGYLNDVAQAIALAVESKGAGSMGDIVIVRALEGWQPRTTSAVLAEVEDPTMRARFEELADLWDRSGRALVHRLGALIGPDAD